MKDHRFLRMVVIVTQVSLVATPSENIDKHRNFYPQNFGSVFLLKVRGGLFHIIDVLK